ncbi:hypothetical protein AOQ84DRAFT_402932 [Glonium stellatum]|uniref:Heterokaryon incompatibility domain-containing protein n=1 Tax=Glonium stellatum TaxID=574774 RepID=A0A8E2JUT5_9PEZI|nr:hypothetical protein AOQ84DRAFT_402932 [Glonium stellatum]
MGSIYKNAQEVLVWLGRDDADEASSTFNFIGELNLIMPTVTEQAGGENVIGKVHQVWNAFDSSRHDLLRRLLGRPWFTRTWILQEIGLAQSATFFVGAQEIDWESLKMSFVWVILSDPAFNSPFALHTFNGGWKSGFPMTITDVLQTAVSFSATDPRDKVFGLLSHPSAHRGYNNDLLVEPDYTKPPIEIFRDATIKILDTAQNLRVLASVLHYSEESFQDEACPSWVPRWQSSELYFRIGDISLHNIPQPPPNSGPLYSLSPCQKYLTVRGFTLASIVSHSPTLYTEFPQKTATHQTAELARYLSTTLLSAALVGCDPEDTYSATQEPLHEAYACTMRGGLRVEDNQETSVPERKPNDFYACMQRFGSTSPAGPPPGLDPSVLAQNAVDGEWARYVLDVMRMLVKRF